VLLDFGPRFINYGGYEIKYSTLTKPTKRELVIRSRELSKKYYRVYMAIKDIDNKNIELGLAKSILDHRVAFPTFLPVITPSAEHFNNFMTGLGFRRSVQFWNRYNKLVDYKKFPSAKKLKSQITCINLIFDWTDDDIVKLKELLERYVWEKN
jgi:hypothetical protein